MVILGAEVGFVSADRGLVDFLAQVFELEEVPPIEVAAEIFRSVPLGAVPGACVQVVLAEYVRK